MNGPMSPRYRMGPGEGLGCMAPRHVEPRAGMGPRYEWGLGMDSPPWALGMDGRWTGMCPRNGWAPWALWIDGPWAGMGPRNGWAFLKIIDSLGKFENFLFRHQQKRNSKCQLQAIIAFI